MKRICIFRICHFDAELSRSCYYGKMVPGFFPMTGCLTGMENVLHVSEKKGQTVITWSAFPILRKQMRQLSAMPLMQHMKSQVMRAYTGDEIVDRQLDKLNMAFIRLKKKQIVEIDSVAELAVIDESSDEVIGKNAGRIGLYQNGDEKMQVQKFVEIIGAEILCRCTGFTVKSTVQLFNKYIWDRFPTSCDCRK